MSSTRVEPGEELDGWYDRKHTELVMNGCDKRTAEFLMGLLMRIENLEMLADMEPE
jgi:hypothetical protein